MKVFSTFLTDEMSTWFTPWLRQRFPRLPIALAISLGFEFLFDTLLRPPWMMIVWGVSSVSVEIT